MLLRVFQGKEKLWLVFWIFPLMVVALHLLLLIPLLIFFRQLFNMPVPVIYAFLASVYNLFIRLTLSYLVWINAFNTEHKGWSYLARVLSIIGALIACYEFYIDLIMLYEIIEHAHN